MLKQKQRVLNSLRLRCPSWRNPGPRAKLPSSAEPKGPVSCALLPARGPVPSAQRPLTEVDGRANSRTLHTELAAAGAPCPLRTGVGATRDPLFIAETSVDNRSCLGETKPVPGSQAAGTRTPTSCESLGHSAPPSSPWSPPSSGSRRATEAPRGFEVLSAVRAMCAPGPRGRGGVFVFCVIVCLLTP